MKEVLIFLALGIFLYSFLVERFWIKMRREKCDLAGLKVVILSDLHLGIFKGERFLRKVVDLINKEDADLVFWAGDFVYRMNKWNLAKSFGALKEVKAPMFGVLGNHDIKPVGEFEKEKIVEVLESVGVKMIDNRIEFLEVARKKVQLIGVGSLICGDDDYRHFDRLVKADVTVAMTHNPDAVHNFPAKKEVDVVLCGHTHGGQIRVPWLYKKVIPCKYAADKGWSEVKGYKVFTSSGLGEVNLPLRLGVRPEVVVMG